MSRSVQAVLLVFVGAAVLQISLGDLYLRYVKEGLQPLLVASGICLLALGVATELLDDTRDDHPPRIPDHNPDHGHGHDEGHSHEHGPRVGWLLVVPVLAILLVAPPALGSFAAARASGAVAEPASSDFPPLPATDPASVPLWDFAQRAVWDEGRTLQGRQVVLTGFVTPGRGGSWYLTRMALSCCAADAGATKIDVRGAAPPTADSWVRVTGTFSPSDSAPGQVEVPAVRAAAVEPVPAPRNSYE